MRLVAAAPSTPACSGVMDTRHVPARCRRIVQVATSSVVALCVATVHDPRTVLTARAATRASASRVALIR